MDHDRDADELRRWVRAAVDRSAADLVALSEQLRTTPELGYAEERTAARVVRWLADRGVAARTGLACTGVKAVLDGRTPGPSVAVIGELDAVHVPTHPDADPLTGAAHACGHQASLAAACGAFAALREVMSHLDGRVVLLAVPAEEMVPSAHLDGLRVAGTVARATGKPELIDRGELDDVDLAMMVHTGREGGPRFSVGDTLAGAVRVSARFEGTAAHSGSSPWLGVDATRAARLAVTALDAQSGTFPDADGVRLATQLQPPSAALGAVPATTGLEVLVRANTLAALENALPAIDRALYAGAVAVGARLRRTSELMYVPHRSAPSLDTVVEANADAVVDGEHARGRRLGACSDIGDLSLLMPVSHPYASGAVGHHHSPTFRVSDHRQATVEPATYLATTVVDLLHDGARGARAVLATDPPRMSREQYGALRASFTRTRTDWPTLVEGTAR